MGLDRIDEALQPLGVTEIVCNGKPFDPRIMKAADIEETGEVPDGTVLEVYRTGYMIDAEILQPAQVKVARAPRSE
jgi:molecular chaperone GrpE